MITSAKEYSHKMSDSPDRVNHFSITRLASRASGGAGSSLFRSFAPSFFYIILTSDDYYVQNYYCFS